jgi:hypothetical protein
VRHSLTPEDGIADAGGSKAMKARALVVEDDTIPVLPNVPAAEGGEGRRRRPLEHAGEGMQLVHLTSRTRGRADGRPETAGKGTPKDDVRGVLDRRRAYGAVSISRLDDLRLHDTLLIYRISLYLLIYRISMQNCIQDLLDINFSRKIHYHTVSTYVTLIFSLY